MDTSRKIGATIVTGNFASAVTALGLSCASGQYKDYHKEFIISIAFSTLPAVVSIVLDKYVFQNLTDNKALQYGLTAATVFAGQIAMMDDSPLQSHFWIGNSKKDNIFNTILKASVIGQACALKWIWDDLSKEVVIEEISVEDPLSTEGYEAELIL